MVFGPFPSHCATTAAMAWDFYAARPLSAMAWADLALTALALAARAAPRVRAVRRPGHG